MARSVVLIGAMMLRFAKDHTLLQRLRRCDTSNPAFWAEGPGKRWRKSVEDVRQLNNSGKLRTPIPLPPLLENAPNAECQRVRHNRETS